MLPPFLSLAAKSAVAMNDKYIQLLPVFSAVLDTSELNKSLVELIVSSLAKLLKNATCKHLGDDFLLKILPRLQHSLGSADTVIFQLNRFEFRNLEIFPNALNLSYRLVLTKICLATLECLYLIAQRWPVPTLLPFCSPIMCSLANVSRRKKEIVRRAVADVRAAW
ncbi:unnamed protein product [Gongylonema pulchrum]|uniref:MMS19 nucleotide excision repair protein n=1 Tax=Gongylonema pulchrum TaxID=637853 RepID=A0A3P7LNV3_9BILA|nr:unnamed protein product [Gongylonema pulchrum]